MKGSFLVLLSFFDFAVLLWVGLGLLVILIFDQKNKKGMKECWGLGFRVFSCCTKNLLAFKKKALEFCVLASASVSEIICEGLALLSSKKINCSF
jgi:hypothetical protein